MQSGDLPAGFRLASQAGWNQSFDDWELIFSHARDNSWVAIKGKEIVGTVTSINFSNLFDWVGMMVIDPDHRRQGIGKNLMQKVINGSTTGLVRLDASVMGAKLYEKLGFQAECIVTRFKRIHPAKQTANSLGEIRNLESSDLEDICSFDFKQIGYDRSKLLRPVSTGGHGWIYRSNQGVRGFLMARLGRKDIQIGPIVAENQDIAESLLIHASEHLQDRPVVVDVFPQLKRWLSILRANGFEADRSFIRMQLGETRQSMSTQGQYAILDPAMG